MDAIHHFHTAISLNANNKKAAVGLERLERVMKGLDPDGDDEDDLEEGMNDEGSFGDNYQEL